MGDRYVLENGAFTRDALSPRQRQALDVIMRHIELEGWPPTLREIGVALGIGSTNGVNDLVRALERKGYITRRPMLSRGIRVHVR